MKRILLVLLLLLVAGSVYAQQIPQPVQDAFADLNQKLGTNYTTSDISWRWSENIYPDRNLGCTNNAISNPAPENIRGYQVVLEVPSQGTVDYRISYDPAIFLLCSPAQLNIPQAGTTAIPFPSSTPSQCGNFPSRLVIGQEARVSPGIPNNLRALPGASGDFLGEIPAEAVFMVLDGPRCSADGAWWQVNYQGLVGWTLESQNGEYYLEPMSLVGLATIAPTVAPINATPTPIPVCNPEMPSRLIVDGLGRVTPGIPNNVRALPGESGEFVGEIPAEAIFTVLDGPSCASGMAWWQVDYQGMIGWTSEGTAGDYWLEPQFAVFAPLTAENFANSTKIGEYAITNIDSLLFTPQNTLYVQNAETITQIMAQNRFVPAASMVLEPLTYATSPTSFLAVEESAEDFLDWTASVNPQGDVSISQLSRFDIIEYTERFVLEQTGVSQGVFSPDARYLLLVDSSQSIQIFDTQAGQVIVILPNENFGDIRQVEFSPDGRFFAAGTSSGFIVWETANWSVLGSAFFDEPQSFQSLALNNEYFAFALSSPQDNIAFVVALSDINAWTESGSVRFAAPAHALALAPNSNLLLIANETGLEFAPIPTGDELLFASEFSNEFESPISDVRISPDGRLLAVATANGLSLWAVATD